MFILKRRAIFLEIFVILNLLICLSQSAIVEGTVYDENLEEISAVITIKKDNLMYSQITARDGHYKIEIQSGNYTFIVWNAERNLSSTYKLNIENDSIFDFILIPSQFQPIDLPEIINIEEGYFPEIYEEKEEISLLPIFALIIAILIFVIFIYFYARKKSEEISKKLAEEIEELKKKSLEEKERLYLSDEERIYQIIQERKEIPQKEIVKITGFSKAKVTLILEKLERKGKIERLSIGREKIVRMKK